LLNDARFKANLPPLGFINPWLYANSDNFVVDIVGGGARGCDGTNYQTGARTAGSAKIPGAVWNSTIGWDAATGLGVFDFQKALKDTLKNKGSF
jgi:tripeptidyl-peptidase-1